MPGPVRHVPWRNHLYSPEYFWVKYTAVQQLSTDYAHFDHFSGGSAIEQWWKSGCHVPLATVNVICRKINCDVYPHISTVSTRCFYLQTAKIHVNLCLHNSWAKWPCNYESPTQIRIRANSLNYLTHLELAEVQKYHPDIYHLVKLNKCPWQLNVFNGADQKPQDAAEARRPSRVHSSFHGGKVESV